MGGRNTGFSGEYLELKITRFPWGGDRPLKLINAICLKLYDFGS